MYSAYKLNKQGDNIQPWHTPFPIWNQSLVPCPVLTVASWPAYRFLRRQVKWSGTPNSWRFFHILLWSKVKVFGIINKAEVDVFLELSCSFKEPMDIGNLISGSFSLSKSSLNICKFMAHVLLKPGLENFEHCFSRWVRLVKLCGSFNIFWHCHCMELEWKLTLSSPVATAEFSKFTVMLSAALSQHCVLVKF